MELRRLCVFCGSASGANPEFERAAISLGSYLGSSGIGVVYGGAHVGLMGALADAALDVGGEVIGVMPEYLIERELAHTGLSDLVIVPDMHTRKRRMYDLADGFCALPGGYGTLDEIFEALTWSQLGLHDHSRRKRVALLDVDDFWAPMLAFLDAVRSAEFVKSDNRGLIRPVTSPADAVAALYE